MRHVSVLDSAIYEISTKTVAEHKHVWSCWIDERAIYILENPIHIHLARDPPSTTSIWGRTRHTIWESSLAVNHEPSATERYANQDRQREDCFLRKVLSVTEWPLHPLPRCPRKRDCGQGN